MTTIKEIHNRENLNPQDYDVLDYLDNQPPRYMGGPIEAFEAIRKSWVADFERYFPGWNNTHKPSIHHCHHCGNGTVRYIAICIHRPTGDKLVFGSDCVCKLEFPDRQTLKLAQIKAKAEQGHARLRVYNLRVAFLANHPEIAAIIDGNILDKPVHSGNSFARDIFHKLDLYGELSVRQVESVLESLRRDRERETRKQTDEAQKAALLAAGVTAPEGRQTVRGVVLHTRTQETQFGEQLKWLVKLESGAKVWSSIPASMADNQLVAANRGYVGLRVQFTATFERKQDDVLFAFGSRPSKATVLTS